MRLARPLPLLAALLVAPAAAAAPVVVAPFTAPGDLAIFGPEVARSLAAALGLAGLDLPPSTSVTGRIEPLDSERVRLRATLLGRSAEVEGALERIDALAIELSARLCDLVPASMAHRPASAHPAHHPLPAAATSGARATAASPSPGGAPPSVAVASPAAPASAAATGSGSSPTGNESPSTTAAPSPAPAGSTPTAATASPDVAPSPPHSVAPSPGEPAAGAGAGVAPPPTTADSTAAGTSTPAAGGGSPDPSPPPLARPVEASGGAGMRPDIADPVAPVPALRPFRPFGRGGAVGRAVLHVVRTPTGCGGNELPTAAARALLERNLRVRTLPGGCGIYRPADAAAEAARFGVPSVVMASVDDLRFEATFQGYRPVGRLRLQVVRDGSLVFERAVLVSAARSFAAPDGRAGAQALVAQAFTRFAAELSAVLVEAR